ncbi:MAG: hypothetical protein LiPW31_233 [Microgenomates group bacterium LiPW_31]|nr:MAG: hypothetical protein LiPW31_233 [Microgenomates group bacterium LiPW_31]
MLQDKIQADLKIALKAKDELRVSTLRLLLSETHNREIEKQTQLSDEDVVAVIHRGIKQRQEAIEAYQKGNRDDLIKKEQAELAILNKYLPQQMPSEELEKIVKEAISEVEASGPGDFGKVMGVVMGKVKGKAEGGVVAGVVKKLL